MSATLPTVSIYRMPEGFEVAIRQPNATNFVTLPATDLAELIQVLDDLLDRFITLHEAVRPVGGNET